MHCSRLSCLWLFNLLIRRVHRYYAIPTENVYLVFMASVWDTHMVKRKPGSCEAEIRVLPQRPASF